ncbi:hypothetical protein CW736_08735 [Nonlabens sp. MB-3u-79]|jgi:hypothetical protein|uniref:hypothetical protein n=1 Tax=Nonlabens sp. MB-3u-79 TaxID=2058134 RepID=UPI000C3127F1|nr:hypothetical protein [Nonlabens sp. MB-3u-79]AUC79454.1 hypothetical protein CW736_08735 [Nonlabens sp. MB-3u-79]|tara:strand:- start:547 stop:1053 length:507 start_codon:yes stop_codon:yes gene_type:complete
MRNNNIHTQAGFKVPDGYFDQLTDRVLENTQDQDLQDHAGFIMPEDYLLSLEDRVMSRLEQQTKVIPLQVSKSKQWLYPVLAMAALFIGFITINGLFTQDKVTFADLEDHEITDFLVDADFMQDEESVALLFADNTILKEIEMEENITDKELFDYLMEDASLNQIIIE